jgi:hypothetical protein
MVLHRWHSGLSWLHLILLSEQRSQADLNLMRSSRPGTTGTFVCASAILLVATVDNKELKKYKNE